MSEEILKPSKSVVVCQPQSKPKWPKYFLFVFISLLLLASGAVLGYWWGRKTQNSKRKKAKLQLKTQSLTPTKTSAVILTPTLIPVFETGSWKTYRDDEFGFEISYPKEWRIEKDCVAGIKSEYTGWRGADCLKSPDFRGYLGVPAHEIERGTAIIFRCDKSLWGKSSQSIMKDCLEDKQKFLKGNLVCKFFKGQNIDLVEIRPNEYHFAEERGYCSIIIEPINKPDFLANQILSSLKLLD